MVCQMFDYKTRLNIREVLAIIFHTSFWKYKNIYILGSYINLKVRNYESNVNAYKMTI